MSTTILIVDDEPAIVDVLTYNLEKAHYRVVVARDGEEALKQARCERPDLIILDLMLPGMDGLEVCREIRREGDLPIIMLTARDEEIDRVVGLELGADDYVVKPFSVRELMARVKTVLRRMSASPSASQPTLAVSLLTLDPDRHEVQWDGKWLLLSALEFELLHTFMRHIGQVLTREQLLNLVWGYDYTGDLRVVDTAVKRLRSKMRTLDPRSADLLITVRGVGYKLTDRD
ncbi:MAG: DNA-binding response regulator [Chloroflexi bacterium RBG_16_48_8]|nr:MAG: DNA-binding response regulator [Chloroflexi bacterium RBG_16_48_8]